MPGEIEALLRCPPCPLLERAGCPPPDNPSAVDDELKPCVREEDAVDISVKIGPGPRHDNEKRDHCRPVSGRGVPPHLLVSGEDRPVRGQTASLGRLAHDSCGLHAFMSSSVSALGASQRAQDGRGEVTRRGVVP